ncbi:MAG: regulatory iron-sulfur-containing complex subunit RicT [Bacteroidia bacterium]|nr:regulatory iron-sulfur-containing complex subunit RicT [Bacteroidia bacterium]
MLDYKNTLRGCYIINGEVVKPPLAQCGCASKLDVNDWLKDVPETGQVNVVEVRFKNTRKGFFLNVNELKLERGDIVAVEAASGHDIGIVSLTGELVLKQLKKYDLNIADLLKVYRKTKSTDLEKWKEAIDSEEATRYLARIEAERLNLSMKIGDVEYQGDKTKAIFYYIADERLDFRELIKVLADKLKVRIEMRQIGARQEAGRLGGLGPCGRELCCSSFITNFVSVTTNSARHQELSLNPQKLAGQCGKLKCCLNYEVDCYIEAQKDFPDPGIILQTQQGAAYHQKNDIFRKIMWYSFDKDNPTNLVPVSIEKVKDIIRQNKQNIIPEDLSDIEMEGEMRQELDYENVVGQDSLTRFDRKEKRRQNPNRNKQNNNYRNNQNNQTNLHNQTNQTNQSNQTNEPDQPKQNKENDQNTENNQNNRIQ